MRQRPRSSVRRAIGFVTAFSFAVTVASPTAVEAATVRVPAGTPVVLQADAAISPQTIRPGDSVTFLVMNDVVVDGRVVIKSGARAKGEVEKAQRRGMIGKPDIVTVRINSVTAADGKELSLSALKTAEGDDKVVLTVVLALICLPLLLLKGGEAHIPAGSTVTAQTIGTSEVIVSRERPGDVATKLATWPTLP